MKNKIIIFLILTMVLLTGCISTPNKTDVIDNTEKSNNYPLFD